MTYQSGSPGRAIKLTTPNISSAVADVIKSRYGALIAELNNANGLFEQAKQAATQSMMDAKEWRNGLEQQYAHNMSAEEQLAATVEGLKDQDEKKEELIAQLGG